MPERIPHIAGLRTILHDIDYVMVMLIPDEGIG
jgi:hypothetical protein